MAGGRRRKKDGSGQRVRTLEKCLPDWEGKQGPAFAEADLDLQFDSDELRQGLREGFEKALKEAEERAYYKVEVHLRQKTETSDPHVQAYRYFGHITIVKRGSEVVEGVLEGVEEGVAFCFRQVDRGDKGRTHACGQVIDPAFLTGNEGYCVACKERISFDADMVDMLRFSYGTIGKVAKTVWQMVEKLDPKRGADIVLHRYLGDKYTPTMLVKGKDIAPSTAQELLKGSDRKETPLLTAKELWKAREAGDVDPVHLITAMLKA